MEKKYPVRIGELMDRHIRSSDPFVNGMKESLIMGGWLEVVGAEIAEYTSKLYIRDRKLYVGFSSPVVRSEFYAIRKSVLYRLNGKVGEAFIKLIIVI